MTGKHKTILISVTPDFAKVLTEATRGMNRSAWIEGMLTDTHLIQRTAERLGVELGGARRPRHRPPRAKTGLNAED